MKSLHEYCAERSDDTLLRQWHPSKNGNLTPDQVAPYSKRRVWWICENGHEWEAIVYSRTMGGNGCPYCGGRKVLIGFNDLATVNPKLAEQWHPEKNGELTPKHVTAGSYKKVWWICEKGHEWKTLIASRTGVSSGCPYCAGSKVLVGFNDLATVEPKIAAQWHPELNGELTPEHVTRGSNKNAWWVCSEGHVWKARIGIRAGPQKTGCPVCAGKVREGRKNRYQAIMA